MTDDIKYFAVVDRRRRSGHTLDFHPSERQRHLAEIGALVVGEFSTAEAAAEAIRDALWRPRAGARRAR
jgi:hypothetical protein